MNGIEQTPSPVKARKKAIPRKKTSRLKKLSPLKTPGNDKALRAQEMREYRAEVRDATKQKISVEELRAQRMAKAYPFLVQSNTIPTNSSQLKTQPFMASNQAPNLFQFSQSSPSVVPPAAPNLFQFSQSSPSVVPPAAPNLFQFSQSSPSVVPPPTPKPQGSQEHVNTPVKTPPRDAPYFLTKHQTPIKKEAVDFAKRSYNANDEELADLDDNEVDELEDAQEDDELEEITVREREQDEMLGIAANNAINILAGINQRQDSRRRDLDKKEERKDCRRKVGKKFRKSF